MDTRQVPLALPALERPRWGHRGDLTAQEQRNVRAALRFLRVREGGLDRLAKLIRGKKDTLVRMGGRRPPSAGLAVRLARLAGVPVDDVLCGRFPPPNSCPHCGTIP